MVVDAESSPFLAQVISNWLKCADERGYQYPFAQLLVDRGCTVLYVSKHTSYEQGKDLVAVDAEGVLHAYQLKVGDIGTGRWRREVMPEVQDLVKYAVELPSVKPGTAHESHLVTTGTIEDPVLQAMNNLNRNEWQANPIDAIAGSSLLAMFLESSQRFVPSDVGDYKVFLDLCFADARDLVNPHRLSEFLERLLGLYETEESKKPGIRKLSTAALYVGYMLQGYRTAGNHISAVHALSVFGCYVLAYAEKHGIDDKEWEPVLDLVIAQIHAESQALQEEIRDGVMDEMYDSPWDGILGQARKHIACEALFAYKLSQLLSGDVAWSDIADEKFVENLRESIIIAGESHLLSYVFRFYFLLGVGTEDEPRCSQIISEAVDIILSTSGSQDRPSQPSPYYLLREIAEHSLGVGEEAFDEDFDDSSFFLRPLLDIIVRHGWRSELADRWRAASKILQLEFVPDHPYGYFVWRARDGATRSVTPELTASWGRLRDEALDYDGRRVPISIAQKPEFLPFYLAVFPHRFSPLMSRFLDDSCTSALAQSKDQK